jgi:hypothetical protein
MAASSSIPNPRCVGPPPGYYVFWLNLRVSAPLESSRGGWIWSAKALGATSEQAHQRAERWMEVSDGGKVSRRAWAGWRREQEGAGQRWDGGEQGAVGGGSRCSTVVENCEEGTVTSNPNHPFCSRDLSKCSILQHFLENTVHEL